MESYELNAESKVKKIDLVHIYKELYRKKYFILKALLIGFVIGIVVAISLPNEYATLIKLAPESVNNMTNGKVISLASLMGIENGNEYNNVLPAEYYPDIVKSTPFLMSFWNLVVKPEKLPEMSLYEYIVAYQKKAWWNSPVQLIHGIFSDKSVELDTSWNQFCLTQTQRMFIEELKERIVFEKTENKNIVTIKIMMQDPLVVARVGEFLEKELNRYISRYKQEQVQQDLSFTQKMYEEVKNIYAALQEKREETSTHQVQLDIDVVLGMFNMLSQQYDMLKLKVEQERKVFTVIEPATVPLSTCNLSWIVLACIFVFLFVFGAIMWILFLFAFKVDYSNNGK